MKYNACVDITLKTTEGEISLPRGSTLELTVAQAEKLGSRVKQIDGYTAAINPVSVICYACKGVDFWQSIYDRKVCRRCHPPAPGAEVSHATTKQ